MGKNGSGKTTLLKLLQGSIKPDNGLIRRDSEVIGYVLQDIDEHNRPSLDLFDEWRLFYAMERVNLEHDILTKPLRDLSGGQRTRLAIAYVLAQNPQPTVLLLDEPTNNLDKEGVDWLKSFIRSFQGKIVVVTHDRAFINAIAEKLWILDDGKLQEFKGNYDDYSLFQEEERKRATREYENHQQEQQKVKKLIRDAADRSKGGSRDRKARDNDKFVKHFKNEYVQNSLGRRTKALRARLERLDPVEIPDREKKYKVALSGEANATKILLKLDHVTKRYHGFAVLEDLNMTIFGSDRIWVKGRNGSGKSTLLKICAKKIKPESGIIKYGDGVRAGYFSQDVYDLDIFKSGYEALSRLYAEDEKIYKAAKNIGLLPDLLHQKISNLSRGQQAKIGFLKLLLAEYDLLILDEPTNHLDIATKESIEQALSDYNGALIIASHDEYFIDQLSINREIVLNK
ncbi:MAG TPA: ABC-F family ATP-binding cassette domain-containing protein [Candidatus Saccharimonadales bacterium]|nr:ABC-F family ATP-binding cassette domain-containing protein [Candidatus Saccharimonadales bacterium]